MMMSLTSVNFGYVLGLTSIEKLDAMRRFSSDFMTDRWFILAGSAAIVVLSILFFAVGRKRRADEKKVGINMFAQLASERGLTDSESQLLTLIASKAKLSHAASIFNLERVFNRTAGQLLKEMSSPEKIEENIKLQSQISALSEKLGFCNEIDTSAEASGKLTSRQIGSGKKVFISCRQKPQAGEVEAEVLESNNNIFSVRLAKSINITFGDYWCVRHFAGAAVWEFDTTVVSYDGGILGFNHCDDVRCINRRRFVRVPVRSEGFIAEFPFERILSGQAIRGKKMQLPEFYPAMITELGGPGLRVESKVKMNKGQRVIVTFNLQADDTVEKRQVVEDIGQVRDVRAGENGYSMAIELTGLTDSNIAELVRVTNSTLIRHKKLNEQLKESLEVLQVAGV